MAWGRERWPGSQGARLGPLGPPVPPSPAPLPPEALSSVSLQSCTLVPLLWSPGLSPSCPLGLHCPFPRSHWASLQWPSGSLLHDAPSDCRDRCRPLHSQLPCSPSQHAGPTWLRPLSSRVAFSSCCCRESQEQLAVGAEQTWARPGPGGALRAPRRFLARAGSRWGAVVQEAGNLESSSEPGALLGSSNPRPVFSSFETERPSPDRRATS